MRKLLILGHARHGKDTAAEYLAKKLGLSFDGSSNVCCEAFIFHALRHKYGYDTPYECYEDRVNHRKEWHDLIADYCKDDKARLGRLIYAENDIYCGIRAIDECEAVIEEFDPIVIWINASNRVGPESKESMQVRFKPGWVKIHNNDEGIKFIEKLDKLARDLELYG